MSYILCDIQEDKIQIAVSENLQSFGDVATIKTQGDFKKDVAALVEKVGDLATDEIRALVCGIPGVCNDDRTAVIRSDNSDFAAWLEEPLVETLKKKLKTNVWLENSTALAGLGEAIYGAGEGYDIVAYHSIGDLVTGVKIENGVIDSAAYSFEPGHQILDIDQTILGEDQEATLENLVSTGAVESRTGERPNDIPQSDAVWDQLAEYLAYGLRNTTTYWSPDAIVLSGDMILGEPHISIDAIITHLSRMSGDEPVPDIVDADLKSEAILYGAMAFLNQKV